MKLAEALNRRADLQNKVAQIRQRLANNVKVQEGDEPAESPENLFSELDGTIAELEEMIVRINKTNQQTQVGGTTLTQMIARKDMLSLRHSVLNGALEAANVTRDRYSRSEIKFVRTVDVAALQAMVDRTAKSIRETDTALQQANWTTELL